MANEFLTTKNIARRALPALENLLVMPNLCYRDYSDTFAMQGDTIRVRKPVSLTASEFVAGSQVSAVDVKENSVDVKLDTIATVDVQFEAIEAATNLDNLNRLVIEPAARALADKINTDGLKLYSQLPVGGGTAGTTPDGLDDLAAVRKALNAAKAPLNNRCAIWDVEADAKFTQISNIVKVSESGTASALREGEIGRIYGLDNYMSQSVATHTIAGAGTVLIDGAATAGATSIHLDGITTALIVGDTFTIANDSTVYTVTEAGTLKSADQDVGIVPALQKNAADNTAVTMGSSYTANLAFHKNAIAFVTRPLSAPAGVESYTTSYNGISLRVVRGYDMAYKREKMSIDVLYGYKVVYPELGIKYLG